MSVHDLIFEVVSTNETIYDPLIVTSIATSIRVTNLGIEDLEDLGLWIIPATSVGDVDAPADYPPETDYQDLLTWGTSTDLGLSVSGGIEVSLPQTVGADIVSYVTRTQGAIRANKLVFTDLVAQASAVFTVELEVPPAEPARRLYVDLVIE